MKTNKNETRREWGSGSLLAPGVHGKYWVARWKFGGKTYKRSTGTTDKRDAERLLREYVAPFQSSRAGNAAKGVAEALLDGQARAEACTAKLPRLAVRDAWDVFAAVMDGKRAVSTLRGLRYNFEAFVRWLEANREGGAGVKMAEVGAQTVEDFVTADPSATASTRMKKMIALKSIWRAIDVAERKRLAETCVVDKATFAGRPWARLDRVEENARWWSQPLSDVCQPRADEIEDALPVAHKSFTRDELARLFETAKAARGCDSWYLLYRVAAQTGLRMGDAVNLRFGVNVRLEDGETGRLLVVPRKTGRRSTCYVDTALGRELHAAFSAMPQAREAGAFVFPDFADRYNRTASNIVIASRRVMERAGFETSETAGKGKRRATYSFHSLRYTAARVMAAMTNVDAARGVLGHADARMTAYYLRGDKPAEVREAEARAWEDWFNGKPAKTPAEARAAAPRADGYTEAPNAQKADFDAVAVMLEGLDADALREVAARALKLLAVRNGGKAARAAVAAS